MVRNLLPMSKQGQNKILARNARAKLNTGPKISENEDDFGNFRKWQQNFRSWKTGKSHGGGHGI